MHDLVYLVFITDVKMIMVKANLSIYRIDPLKLAWNKPRISNKLKETVYHTLN